MRTECLKFGVPSSSYEWYVSLFLEPGHYYVPSSRARIKIVATGPENFMVQAIVSSRDFCPPIDYDSLSPEDQQLVDQLVSEGVIDESEVIRGGVKIEEPAEETITQEEPAVQETGGGAGATGEGTTDENITGENQDDAAVDGDETISDETIQDETMGEETITDETLSGDEKSEEEAVDVEVQMPEDEAISGDIATEDIEAPPATEQEPVLAPSNDSDGGDGGGGDSGTGTRSGSGDGSGGDAGASGSADSATAPADSGSAGE